MNFRIIHRKFMNITRVPSGRGAEFKIFLSFTGNSKISNVQPLDLYVPLREKRHFIWFIALTGTFSASDLLLFNAF